MSEGKTDPIYKAHSYHTKVPHLAIVPSILHYTDPGDVVLDGFCGSGMTGVAAQWCGAAPREYRYRLETEWGKQGLDKPKWGARRVLRSFLDWDVLKETGVKGVYSSGLSLAVEDSRLIAWLVEASLHSRSNGSAPLKDLLDSPGLFPFRLKPIHAESLLAASSRLDILRHGLDDDLVMLRKPSTKGSAP